MVISVFDGSAGVIPYGEAALLGDYSCDESFDSWLMSTGPIAR
jgi:hypothetical protein